MGKKGEALRKQKQEAEKVRGNVQSELFYYALHGNAPKHVRERGDFKELVDGLQKMMQNITDMKNDSEEKK